MRMLVTCLLLLAATGCGQVTQSTAASPSGTQRGDASSGIEGTITVDIGCPTVITTPCPRRPLRARLFIRPAGSADPTVVAESGTDGRFHVSLPPGHYAIEPRNMRNAPVPTAFPLSVTVRPGAWTTLSIEFDSGIR